MSAALMLLAQKLCCSAKLVPQVCHLHCRTYAVFDLQSYRALYAFTTGGVVGTVRRWTHTGGQAHIQSASISDAQGSPALGTDENPPQLLHLGSGRIQDVKVMLLPWDPA
jgi:hypothetical protein